MDLTRLPHAPYPLAPESQTACYSPWLKVRVLMRAALSQGGTTQRKFRTGSSVPFVHDVASTVLSGVVGLAVRTFPRAPAPLCQDE